MTGILTIIFPFRVVNAFDLVTMFTCPISRQRKAQEESKTNLQPSHSLSHMNEHRALQFSLVQWYMLFSPIIVSTHQPIRVASGQPSRSISFKLSVSKLSVLAFKLLSYIILVVDTFQWRSTWSKQRVLLYRPAIRCTVHRTSSWPTFPPLLEYMLRVLNAAYPCFVSLTFLKVKGPYVVIHAHIILPLAELY